MVSTTQGTNRTSLCTDPLNQPPVNYWGESYGPGSRCFESTITDSRCDTLLPPKPPRQTNSPHTHDTHRTHTTHAHHDKHTNTHTHHSFNSYLVNGGSTCHNFRCRSGTLQVSIKGAWVSCPTAGGSISVPGFRGTFTCPPANEMCPPPPAVAYPSTSPASSPNA
jgi:hypothetical protein